MLGDGNIDLKIGKTFYRLNKKTREVEELKIVDVQYVFNKKIGSRANYTESEIKELIEENNIITDDIEVLKRAAIEKIEKQFNIKLKEV